MLEPIPRSTNLISPPNGIIPKLSIIKPKIDNKTTKKPISITHPELCKEWDYVKNGDLRPQNFTYGSHKVINWKCLNPNVCEHHRWSAPISNRTKAKPSGCPFCNSGKVCPCNNLTVTHPELCKEWDYERNGNLRPENFAKSSARKVNWKCLNSDACEHHRWSAPIYARAVANRGCPFCITGRTKVCPCNNITVTHPELCKEWDYERNGDLKLEDFTYGSTQEIWWKCLNSKACEHHRWQATLNNRTNSKLTGCPFCIGKVCPCNNLTSTHSELCKEWDYERNGNLRPEDFTFGSRQKIIWKCPKNIEHNWVTRISERVRSTGCPKCLDCPSCGLWRSMGKLCEYCQPTTQNKLYRKTKEIDVVKFLRENLDESFIHNRSIGSECTDGHLFPDIRFECGFYNVMVEVDEFKHRGANYTCDKQRMYDIIAKLGVPSIFIRYNPDNKNSDKNVLLEKIKYYLDIEFKENNYVWDDYGFLCEYLYY